MYKLLNEVQLNVLRWVNDGRPDGVYDDGYQHRITARALERRGLVKIRGHGTSWTAEMTNDGRHYIAHGVYPESEEPAPRTLVAPRRSPKKPQQSQPTVPTPPGAEPVVPAAKVMPSKPKAPIKDETIPMTAEVRRPHPAIRELRQYKKRLALPEAERERALLILHSLVQEGSADGLVDSCPRSERSRERND